MCGIVGILGTGPVAGSIVDALKRLEYRGYDSAGVATLENGRLERRRAEGKLKNLEAKLAAAALGAPLAIGYGDAEMYLGSDALALAPFTDRIAYLEEGDWVALTRKGADMRPATGSHVKRRIQRSPAGSLLAERGNYRHFMDKEIHEQPEVVGHTLARYIDMGALKLKPFAWPADPKQLKRVTIIGCGTAYMAGLVAKYWIERWARLPVEIDVASEYRYREAPVDDGGLTIFVSQSGETADTLASLRYVKERGAKT